MLQFFVKIKWYIVYCPMICFNEIHTTLAKKVYIHTLRQQLVGILERKMAFQMNSLILVPILWSHFFPGGFAELRFCLPSFGPQRMKDTDCPGGFVFHEPVISPECKFYAKTGDHKGKVLTAPTDICADNTDRVIDNEGDDLSDINDLTYFLWEDFDGANETLGKFTPENICQEECLSDWEDRNIVPDEEPIPDDFDISKVPGDMQKSLKKFNKEMFLRLLMDDDEDEDDPGKPPVSMTPPPATNNSMMTGKTTMAPKTTTPNASRSARSADNSTSGPVTLPPRPVVKKSVPLLPGKSFLQRVMYDSTQLNVIKILSKSMRIILGACAPFVMEDFLEQILKGMIYISRKMEHTFLDVSTDLYKKISKTLDHCGLKRHQEFTLNGSRCEEKSAVEGIYFTKSQEYWPHRLQGWSYRWGRWHPILDASWSIIDFIHSFCYESFLQDMMVLHVYEMSLEGLYPEKMQMLWRLVPTVNNDKFWNNLLQTYDLNITMRNLDACQEGARRASPFLKSLPRPFLTLAELSKPAPPPTAPSAAPKGWNKTIEMYWDRYESLGGFPKLSAEFGKCFDQAHLEEEGDMLENLKQKCP